MALIRLYARDDRRNGAVPVLHEGFRASGRAERSATRRRVILLGGVGKTRQIETTDN
jgi:hypothetical protein